MATTSSVTLALELILVNYISHSNGQENGGQGNAPLRTFRGVGNFTTYYEGNIPIIILSLNDGDKEPSNIPDRTLGCWNGTDSSGQPKCVWEYDCDTNYGLEANCTDAENIANDGTTYISNCLYQNIKLFGDSSRPHYIKNNLAREKIETNTPKTGDDAAAMKNAYQWQPEAPAALSVIWDEIWLKWVPKAKNATRKQCEFGFLFDVHGYPDKGADQLGYLISREALGYDNKQLNAEAESSSLNKLVESAGVNLTDLIKGPNSIGTIMDEQFGWDILPSTERPVPQSSDTYYSGGWSLKSTTSEGFVSAAQIEISEIVKKNETKREKYCRDLSKAITQFVVHFYDITGCSGYSTPSPASEPTAPTAPTAPTTPTTPTAPTTPTTPAPDDGSSGSEPRGSRMSIIFVAVFSLMTFMYNIL